MYQKENIEISENVYKNYIKIIKMCKNNDSNVIKFINSMITINIIEELEMGKKTKEQALEYFFQYAEIIDEKKLGIKNELNEETINNLILVYQIEIGTNDRKKLKDLIQNMKLNQIIKKEKEQLNMVLGHTYEKIITKKEIGAYYTRRDTTSYIVENTVLASIIKNWINIKNKKNNSDKNNKEEVSKIENAILENISLKSVLSDLNKEFDGDGISEILKEIKIIDISCGSGSFIFNAYYLIKQLITEMSIKDISSLEIFEKNLYGVDIDSDAIDIIKFRIFLEKLIHNDFKNTFENNIKNFKKGNSLIDEIENLFEENDKNLVEIKFDVVLGNPPYLEYRNVKDKYNILHYESHKCNNLYAYFLEKNFKILKNGGHMGMIVPISYISTKRMNPIRKMLISNSNYQFCSSYADRPSCLFNGVHQKLNIILLEKNIKNDKNRIYTTNYMHWYSEEKENIYRKISYIKNEKYSENFLFKIGNEIENSIIEKISYNKDKNLLENTNEKGIHNTWVNMRMTFWNKSFLKPQKSKEYKNFRFNKEIDSILFSALLNTNIFFFYWETISDVWHITLKDLTNIKIDFSKISDDIKNDIKVLYQELEKNLEKNKKRVDTKQIEFEYQHKKEKILIDKIDLKFKDYFSLTDLEIEYMRLYQVNFRLNGELNDYLNSYSK